MSERKLNMYEIILLVVMAILISLFLFGCTTIDYNPQTRDFHYSTPPWGRKIGAISVLREEDGSILFEMTDYETEKIADVAGSVAEGVIKGMK